MMDEALIQEFIEAGLLTKTETGDYEVTQFGEKWAYFLARLDQPVTH